MSVYTSAKKKKIKKVSTYKFVIKNITPEFEDKFAKAQINYLHIYNVVLKYLYQHYGVNNLDVYLPMLGNKKTNSKNIGFYYFIKRLVYITTKRLGKEVIFDRQGIDLFIENIVRNFNEYRKKQNKVQRWSNKNKQRYLNTHRCSLSGYGRLSFQHDYGHFKTVSLKQNGTRAIYIVDKHHIKIPYFKIIHTKQSLKDLIGKKVVETQVRQRRLGDYELHVSVENKIERELTPELFQKAVGGDINSAKDEFFCFSDGYLIKWDSAVRKRYKNYDEISRKLQKYIKKHQYDDDNKLAHAKQLKQKIETKKKNIMLDWYRQTVIPDIVKRYPVLVMERLHTIGLRIKRYKKVPTKMRKNINNKLNNIIRPTTFLSALIDAYQAVGQTLILVDPTDTSKTCHECGYINHDLKLQKHWACPNCGAEIERDPNACLNIRDWGINPTKHAVLNVDEIKNHPWVNKNDLITIC